jgi:opacity protein-like surface antigen
MKLKACVVFVIVFTVLSSQLLAFNGLRKGFILGGGVGPGYLTYEGTDKFCLATNFKIGYAPSNSFEIYYLNTVSWFGVYSDSFIDGITGLGLTKYLKSEGRGIFVFGGVGLAVIQELTGPEDDTGFGLIGGVGYDISKHWSIQGDILYTTFDAGAWQSVGVRVSVNFLAF